MDEETERRDGLASSGEPATAADSANVGQWTSVEPPELPAVGNARQRLARLAPWAGALLALVLVGMVAMLFADTRTTDAAVRPTPTATLAPTATPAPTMTPTAIDGFQFYRDPTSHYIIQYPLGWVVSTDNASQGIEFCDDCQNPGYIVQVNTPSNLGDVGPPPTQNGGPDGSVPAESSYQ